MFDINSTVEQLFLALDNNKFNKEARFSSSIKLIPQLVNIKGHDYESRGSSVFYDGVWMSHDFLTALSNPPKSFHAEEEDIKDSDLEEILKRLEGVRGTLRLKKHLPEIKKLSESHLDKGDESAGKKLIEKWKEVEQENKEAVASREKALSGIESLIGKSLAEKVKITLISLPEPKDAVAHIKENFRSVKNKEVKKKEEKPKGYVPVYDKDKTKLTKKDIEYVLGVIKENYKKGLDGIINPINKLFSGDIINTLVMAYRKYGGLEGLVDFLENYDTMYDKLQKRPPMMKLPSNIGEIKAPANAVLESLQEIKDDHPSDYRGSFFEFTENAIDLLLKYIYNGEKIPEFERLFAEMFFSGMVGEIPKDKLPEGVSADDGIMSQWQALKYPEIYNKIKSMKNDIVYMFEKPQDKNWKDVRDHLHSVGKGEKKMVEEHESDGKYLREIKKMINNPRYITDEDKELIKEMKDEQKETERKIFDKGLSEKEIIEKRKKYKEFQKNLKQKDEEKKFDLMSPKEQAEYKIQKKLKENQKEEDKNKKKEEREKKKEEKKDTKKSSNLPLFSRIESLSNKSQNPLVRAELGAILDTLKTVL